MRYDEIRIAVCIITCMRPQGLSRLLNGIAGLAFDHGEPADLRIIVVDNGDGSSLNVYERYHNDLPWGLHWCFEGRRGISFARNTAIAESGDVDFVVFIDDDEVPDANWLDELLRVQQLYDADVVAGPVLSDLGPNPPGWAVRGGFFNRPRRPTGNRIENAFTGNVLFRKSVLDLLRCPFNEQMALMGGEDGFLSRLLTLGGATMVWADDALVTEMVPVSRLRVSWLWQRAFRHGVCRSYIDRRLPCTASHGKWMNAIAYLGRCISSLPFVLPTGRHFSIEAVRAACFLAGLIAGALGIQYEEYKTRHGC